MARTADLANRLSARRVARGAAGHRGGFLAGSWRTATGAKALDLRVLVSRLVQTPLAMVLGTEEEKVRRDPMGTYISCINLNCATEKCVAQL